MSEALDWAQNVLRSRIFPEVLLRMSPREATIPENIQAILNFCREKLRTMAPLWKRDLSGIDIFACPLPGPDGEPTLLIRAYEQADFVRFTDVTVIK